MPRHRSLVVVAVMLASLGRPQAQGSGAWFGTPAPPGVSDPRKPVMNYDDGFAPVPVHFIHRPGRGEDRKSTRLNSSHLVISYAVFCLKKKIENPRHIEFQVLADQHGKII